MMMLVGHANKQYHDAYLDYAGLLLLDRSRIENFHVSYTYPSQPHNTSIFHLELTRTNLPDVRRFSLLYF